MSHTIKLTSGNLIGHFDTFLAASDRARELFGDTGWQITSLLDDDAALDGYIAAAREIARTETGNLAVQIKALRILHPMGLKTAKLIMEIVRTLNESR